VGGCLTHSKLTGRTRYRTQRRLFGRETLVLQVEEYGLTHEYAGGAVDCRWVNRWRDATTADLKPALRGVIEAGCSSLSTPADAKEKP